MGSLVEIGLANALLAGALAMVAILVGHYSRRPALVHALWVLVLVKLVTPPLFSLPVPFWREPELAPVALTALPAPESAPSDAVPVVPPRLTPPPIAAGIPTFTRIQDLIPDRKTGKPPAVKATLPPLPETQVVANTQKNTTAARPVVNPAPAPAASPEVVAEAVPAPSTWPSLLTLLAWVWIAGALLWYVAAFLRIRQFQRLLKQAKPAPIRLQHEASQLATKLGLAVCPRIALLPGPLPPLLWPLGMRAGLFFPETLLPRLQDPERATLLVHELAHLARRDHWVRWLELVVCGLYWWNPLVWIACRQLQAAEEEACDAWVVDALPGYGAAYAGALLETVDFLSRSPVMLPPTASGFGRMHHLKRRLTMIIQGSTPRGLSRTSKALLLLLLLGLPFMPSRVRSAAPPVVAKSAANTPSAKTTPQPPAPPVPTVIPEEPERYDARSRVMEGGGGEVWAAALAPDGKTLAVVAGGTGNNEGTLTLFDYPNGKERACVSAPKPIRCVAYSRDGRYLATGDFSQQIHLRDLKTGEVKSTFTGHTASVNSIAFTPDGKTLISGSLDKTIKFWDIATGKCTRTLEGHTDWVLAVAVSADGKTLLSASRDTLGRVWDLPSGKLRHVLKGHSSWVENVAISPDNRRLVTVGHDNATRVWDSASGKLIHTLAGHTGNVNAAVFFPDSKRLATCSNDLTVRIWDAEKGAETSLIVTGHNQQIHGLAISKDGQSLVTGSWDKSIKVFSVASGKETKSLQQRRYLAENNFPVMSVATSPDGKMLAVSGEERAIKLLDASTGRLLHLLEGHEDVVGRVIFSPDGKILASAGFDGNIGLWDTAAGKRLRWLTGHVNWVFSIAFSRDGKTLVSGGFDRTVRLWDVEKGKETARFDRHRGGVRAVAISPDGRHVASGGSDKHIRLWDVRKRESVGLLKGHEDTVRDLAFSPDGQKLASCGEDMTLRLWDVPSGKPGNTRKFNSILRSLCWSPQGQRLAVADESRAWYLCDPTTLQNDYRGFEAGQQGAFTAVAFSPDARLVYVGSLDRMVRVWQALAAGRKPIATFLSPGKPMCFSVFSPDGRWLATGGEDRLLEVRDARQGRMLGSLPEVKDAVFRLAVSPDGKVLATGCGDKVIRLYDLASRQLLAVLTGHKDRVWSVAFSPDGKRLASASGSWDNADQPGAVKFWDLTTNREIGEIECSASVQAVAWSPDGKTLAVGSRDGLARLYDAETRKERFVLKGHTDAVRFTCFDPTGQYLATAGMDARVRIWSVADGKELAALEASRAGVNCVAWSRDGNRLAATSRPAGNTQAPGEVRVWEVSRVDGKVPVFKQRAVLTGHTTPVLCCAFSPDGKTLASGGGLPAQRGEVIVWDVETRRQRMMLPGHRRLVETVVFGKDGSLITAGGDAGAPGEAHVWHVTDAGWSKVDASKEAICCGAWSPNSKLLATGSFDKTVQLWDATTGNLLATLKGHKDRLRAIAFSPNGKFLASAANDRTVKVWDLETKTEMAEVCKHDLDVTSLSWSPDSKVLATASGNTNSDKPGGDVRLFVVATGKERPKADYSGKGALGIAFSPNGKLLATGGVGTDALRIYDAKTGKLVKQVKANSVRALAWSPNGKLLATAHGTGGAHGNGSIQVFDTMTWSEKAALLDHGNTVVGVSFAPDSRHLASASMDKTVKVWDVLGGKRAKPAPPAVAPPRAK